MTHSLKIPYKYRPMCDSLERFEMQMYHLSLIKIATYLHQLRHKHTHEMYVYIHTSGCCREGHMSTVFQFGAWHQNSHILIWDLTTHWRDELAYIFLKIYKMWITIFFEHLTNCYAFECFFFNGPYQETNDVFCFCSQTHQWCA